MSWAVLREVPEKTSTRGGGGKEESTHSLGHDGCIQLEDNLSSGLSTDSDIEEDSGIGGRGLGESGKGFGGHSSWWLKVKSRSTFEVLLRALVVLDFPSSSSFMTAQNLAYLVLELVKFSRIEKILVSLSAGG